MTKLFLPVFIYLLGITTVFSQNKIDADQISDKITFFKNDIRGPYKDIRWFCSDGSVRAPKDPCPENIGPERPLPDFLSQGPVLSPSRITLEYNEKIRPQPDRENAFARASGGGEGIRTVGTFWIGASSHV